VARIFDGGWIAEAFVRLLLKAKPRTLLTAGLQLVRPEHGYTGLNGLSRLLSPSEARRTVISRSDPAISTFDAASGTASWRTGTVADVSMWRER
jgi:hypothetical protein